MWNLEKWYWWTYLQRRNRDADVEKGLVDTVGEGKDGTNWESTIDMYTTLYEINSGKLLYNTASTAWHSVMS